MTTRTAAHRRVDGRDSYQARFTACPVNRLIDRIGDKWVAVLLNELAEGPRRYGDLTRTIAGASQKMLTETLRHLERDGLISRTVTPAVPVRVDYALTDLGRSLLPVIEVMKQWAEENIDQIDSAREAYDTRDR
ncbi:winged helix-turn-helix transcriptional regulator [Nonomuraea guangzhouensis]|uniref:Winged helix-turn-helix transcriptional regulator n=1 Tax=Nonomuraea guangzhouensis TaxID=1291555 RepID=A0ABW4GLD9_9ACTN|nr:helix-turn-helix domain-containing protein [Nonomuraea guangzhouensis]